MTSHTVSSNKPQVSPTGFPRNIIGWQGITATVPSEWDLGVVSGDRKTGYLRVDDGVMPRMEVKWSTSAHAVDLNRLLDGYLKRLQKNAKKSRSPLDVRKDVRLLSRRRKRKDELICFAWTGAQDAWGSIWRCGRCGRVVVAQVLGNPEENIRGLAENVLASLEDHSPDGWDQWGMYGFLFEIPDDFALEKQRLVTGHLEFTFARGKRKEEWITVARWGMAGILLKNGGLAGWLDTVFAARHRGIRLVCSMQQVKDHPGTVVRGNVKSLAKRIPREVKRLVRHESVPELMCHVWHCSASNKIFAVECFVRPENEYLLEDVTDSVACHEE